MIKKVGLVMFCALLVLAGVFWIRTVQFTQEPVTAPPIEGSHYQGAGTVERLAGALRFATVSRHDAEQVDWPVFKKMHAYLEECFPTVHTTLKKEIVNEYSLLFTWSGTNPALKPIILMAHQDVVPVIPGTEDDWTQPPFAGRVADGYIWGRGALDDKSSMMAIMEAVETLVREGFTPPRTVFLAFGHDEEVGGLDGAGQIATLLRNRGVTPEYVLDEGGAIVRDPVTGSDGFVAMLGIAEKGYSSLELSVVSEGGHSSMPPRHTAVGILSRAITRLEDHPFPANLAYTTRFLQGMGSRVSFFQRMLFANQWLFAPLIVRGASESHTSNAMIRTTTAATMFNGSIKDNVLPIRASAVVNFRIMPGETMETVKTYVEKVIDDPSIVIAPYSGFGTNPSPASDTDSAPYKLLAHTIQQVSGDKDILPVPFLVLGGTDSRYFSDISPNVYRFLFIILEPEDLPSIHGTNERISLENYRMAIDFYYQLLRNTKRL